MQIAIPIATLLLGAVLGAWYTVYLKRPKLKIVGSGGGGGAGHYQNYVRVANQPGLLGMRLSETIILGKRIHGVFEKGLTVDRSPANECRASIHDKQSGRHVALLWWRATGQLAPYGQIVTVRSGETFDLMLFARLEGELTKYFVFAPETESSDSLHVPSEEAKFHDTHEFVVRIDYSYGRQKLAFDTTMRKDFDGRLRWEGTKVGSGSF